MPGNPPNVGSQLGWHPLLWTRLSGSIRTRSVGLDRSTLVLAIRPPDRPAAVIWRLCASSGTRVCRR